jgi:trimethylamine--corrinoid protein Co-methyltransferase
MRPKIELLDQESIEQILEEAFEVLVDPGVRVHNEQALELLDSAGARMEAHGQIAHIPAHVVERALASAPESFDLYGLDGEKQVHYGGDQVHFDPGSAAISILDHESQSQRAPVTEDFVRFVKLVETLPAIDAQSTAMVCADVPQEIGDLYRLYLALLFMRKPIVTGAFRKDTWWIMREMLLVVAGDAQRLQERPIAIFDVCPSPPLLWSDLTCQNLIDCARSNIPAELVSMPLAGATAPVTLAGAVVQHTAECLSGVAIHQLANEGAPIVWGGSPAAFDMRQGTTPMGSVDTWMIDCAYAQVGKHLDLPTHAYLGMSDAKMIDAQSGLESAGGTLMGALAGVNMISGAGMMDFESCQSLEKLVIDAEIIGMTKRLLRGLEIREKPIARELMRSMGHSAEYLAEAHTLKWFAQEFFIPSGVIDRGSYDAWIQGGKRSALDRAAAFVREKLENYEPFDLGREARRALKDIAARAAKDAGMDTLPQLNDLQEE